MSQPDCPGHSRCSDLQLASKGRASHITMIWFPGLLGSRGRGIALEGGKGRQHRLNWPACSSLQSCPKIPGQVESAVLLRNMPFHGSPCLCLPHSPEPLTLFLCPVWKTPCSPLPREGPQPRKRCGHRDAPFCHTHTGTYGNQTPILGSLFLFRPVVWAHSTLLCTSSL